MARILQESEEIMRGLEVEKLWSDELLESSVCRNLVSCHERVHLRGLSLSEKKRCKILLSSALNSRKIKTFYEMLEGPS